MSQQVTLYINYISNGQFKQDTAAPFRYQFTESTMLTSDRHFTNQDNRKMVDT